MIRRIAITIASSAAICALVVYSNSSFKHLTRSSRMAASDSSDDAAHDVALSRSGYIVASS